MSSRPTLSPSDRKRLQQWFEAGTKAMNKADYRYAETMFTQCVTGDPANAIYAQNFLAAQYRKYNNNKKGSTLGAVWGASSNASMKTSEVKKHWPGVLASGLELLKQNPWAGSTLASIANALGHMECPETEILFLKAGLESAPNDIAINRQMANALAKRGNFDVAISCLNKIRQLKPNDEEATRLIAEFTVNKTIKRGGYEEADSAQDARKKEDGEDHLTEAGTAKLQEQKFLKAIEKAPGELSNYRQLADLYIRAERWKDAEQALSKGLEVSGGEVSTRELLEDIQLKIAMDQLSIADKRAKEQPTPENQELLKRMRTELNQREILIFAARSERYPTNPGFKFELGLRLKRAANYQEAIKALQEARSDIRRKAQVHLELGECFQQIKQYKLAQSNYKEAIAAADDKGSDLHKLALYRAGVLATGLKEWAEAEEFLTQLAGIDFSYKDVPQRLEKLAEQR